MKRGALLDLLRGGDRRSIGRSEEVAGEVLANPLLFKELVRGMMSDDPLVRMRAADAAEKVTTHNPALLHPYRKKLLRSIGWIRQQEVRWHVAQMIPRTSWNPRERKQVVALLTGYLGDKSSIVRTSAMQALAEVALTDSRLRRSITKTIEHLSETGTPAMKARGKRLLPLLRGNPSSD